MGLSPFLELQRLVVEQASTKFFNPFTVLVFFFSIFFLLNRFRRVVWSEKLNLPPSPPRIPIIGNIHQLSRLYHQSFRDLSQKYGPLMLIHLAQSPALVVSSAEMAAEILKTHDLVFANRLDSVAARMIFYGCKDIALAPYGEYWRQVRKICVLELLSIKRVQSFKFVREEEISIVIEKLNHAARAKESINLSEILFGLSNSIISRCSLGDNYKKEYTNRFTELLKEATCLIEAFSFENLFPWLGWMDVLTGFTGNLKRISQELDTFFDQVIDDHIISKSHEDDDEEDDKKNFVHLLLNYTEKDNRSLARDSIKGIILDMFVGGSDTSATVIEWTMAELIKSPKVMKKAQEEIRRVVGEKSKVEEEDIIQMDYLKSVVKESLRLHAPLPTLVARKSSTSAKIGGYDIPPKTAIFINAWAISKRLKIMGQPNGVSTGEIHQQPDRFQRPRLRIHPFWIGKKGVSWDVIWTCGCRICSCQCFILV